MNEIEIKSTLNAKFKETLKDGEYRKIVYWIDVDQAFKDIFDEIEIDGVKKHCLISNNYFYTKYLLEEQDEESHYLIYTTNPLEINIDNWLSDNVMYADKFYADEVSMILRDFDMPESLRNTVNKHKKFFRSNERYERLQKYYVEDYSEEKLQKAMICAICKVSKPSFEIALRKVFENGLSSENKMLKDIYSFLGELEFWSIVSSSYGYDIKDHSLQKLAIHLLITATSFTVDESVLESFKVYISKRQKNNCMLFIDRWLNDGSSDSYEEFAKHIEDDIMFISTIQKQDIETIKFIEVFPSVDKLIIISIANAIKQNKEDYDTYLSLIDARKSFHFYRKYENIYEALSNALKMHKMKKEKSNLLSSISAGEYIDRYTQELYKMDLYYRKFYENYDADNDGDIVKDLRRFVEDLYNNWYLTKLSLEFSDSLQIEKDFYSMSITYQHEFYKRYIEKHIRNNEKVFVVISDALRYEVGKELYDKIQLENRGRTSIEPMISVIPSATKFGMAALLPYSKLEYKDGDVYADGQSTTGILNREKILINKHEDSTALDYKDLMGMSRNEMENCTVGKKIVYIYHNSIDAIGDKAASEIYAFDGCAKAIDELSVLIKRITDRMNGTNIYITADHGFIYVRDKIKEIDKIAKEKSFVENGRRYAIAKGQEEISGLLQFSLGVFQTSESFSIYSPKDNLRFKIQGGGANFVHGGASLHELVIPLITYKNKRTSQKGAIDARKTEIKLTSTIRRITNSGFRISFFQTEPVGNKVKASKIKVCFVNKDDKVISNEVIICGDKKNSEPADRTSDVQFNLKPQKYDRNESYYLVVKDEETDVVIEKTRFEISLAIMSDFEF